MSYKLVVESGSTKTDWALISSSGIKRYQSNGINPASDIELLNLRIGTPELLVKANNIKEIYYYGAGVIDNVTRQRISDWLDLYFQNCTTKLVETDLLGACKATAKRNKAIVSILGTGSNSCLYDGERIIDNIPALGYSLGNEGGGTEVGKAILQSYFYRQMPADVKVEFEHKYSIDKSSVVQSLYLQENPTKYLASFASFVSVTKNKNWRRHLLTKVFQRFIDIRIKTYLNYNSYELHFVGSIAYFCQDILEEILQNNSLEASSIVHKPIDGLIALHN